MNINLVAQALRLLSCVCLSSGIVTYSAHAEPYIPSSPDYIIAEWSTPNSASLRNLQVQNRLQPGDPAAVNALVNYYLQQAAQPGRSRLYGLAEATLKPLIEKNTTDVDLLLAWAQIQQHQHKFSVAQTLVENIIVQAPNNVTANLLAARLQLIQGNPTAAQTYCLRLLGHTDLLTLSTCSLEVRSTLGNKELADSYEQLQQQLATQGLPGDERQVWLLQILADMAIRLNEWDDALAFLNRIKNPKTLSLWVQWSDINLALGNNQQVVEELTKILNASEQADDSLLVRIVVAEKKLAKQPVWQPQLRERIALRELRDDQSHASDLAIYYLDIVPDTKKAVYWAERNWQQARETADKNLLVRAKTAASAINKEGQ
jgi:hypothetical protein